MTQIVTDAITPVQAEADATSQRAADLETAVTDILQKLQAGDTAGAIATATTAVPASDTTAGGADIGTGGTTADTTGGATS